MSRTEKKDPADTLDECVNTAIDRTRQAISAFEGGCDKDSVANLAKLVSIIGELREMVGLAESENTQTGVILLPSVRELQ